VDIHIHISKKLLAAIFAVLVLGAVVPYVLATSGGSTHPTQVQQTP